MSAKEVRDLIVESLKKDKAAATVEFDGYYFSGADIAINDKEGNPESYRIAVISHKLQKQFT